MSLVLSPIVEFYRTILQPVQLLQWFGVSLTSLDLAAAFRLCLVLRQIREQLLNAHLKKAASGIRVQNIEKRSFVREASAVLIVVYGGEALTSPLLGTPPSFMISGVVPLLYVIMQAFVEVLPTVPEMSLNTELPLSAFDGMSRAYLLCNLIAPVVLTHSRPEVATSPWTLLLTSLLTANTGYFVTNLLSFFQPYSLTLTTPLELQPYGWTTTDLWCAPFITGLYALLTHAQPFWADAHTVLTGWLGSSVGEVVSADGVAKVAPVDPEVARALCAAVLAALFATRTAKNFAGAALAKKTGAEEKRKVKVQ